MKKYFLAFVLLSFVLCNLGCKKTPTEPPIDNLQPGRRDYVWTVDTLNFYDTMLRLWGSSPTDVWATTRGNFYESIFHFDGNKWSTDGIFRLLLPYSIWGFARNDIYIGGSGGKIWHYDGVSWSQIEVLTKDGHNDIVFDNMWGETPNDFYAFGAYPDDQLLANNSVIAHFINNNWTMLNTDGLQGIVEHLYKNKTDQLIYLQVIKFSHTYDSTFIYKYEGEKYTKLYSTIWAKTWASISLINNEVYFVLENEIAKRINNQFQTVLKIDNPNFYECIWGRNSKDIFLLMTDGLVHYNGSDMEYLFHFNKSGTQIYGAALFENEVFFLVNESQTNLSLIYHGKLNKGE